MRGEAGDSDGQDNWSSRLAKLIPAEALGLYGAGQAIVPADRSDGLWVLAACSLVLAAILRWRATRDATGKPQYGAVCIALVSFVLWIMALKPPSGPIDLGVNAFYASLGALTWGTVLPIVYKGD